MARACLFLAMILLLGCATETEEDKISQGREFLKRFKDIRGDSIYIELSYDQLDSLKRLEHTDYAFFDTAFKKNLEPNELAYLGKFAISDKKEGLLLTTSAAGAYLSAYLFVWSKDSLKAKFVDEVGAFYELHNSGSYLNTWIIKSGSQIQLKKKLRNCNFQSDPENGECKDSALAAVITL